jgi:hypothetical protein
MDEGKRVLSDKCRGSGEEGFNFTGGSGDNGEDGRRKQSNSLKVEVFKSKRVKGSKSERVQG